MTTIQVKRTNRLFPAIFAVAAMAFIAKSGVLYEDISLWSEAAQAQQDQTGDAQDQPEAETQQDSQAGQSAQPPMPTGAASRSELQLLEELASRRTSLDKRENEIELREQLLAATEQRLDAKIAELKAVEERIQGLIVQYEEQENAQLANIVKVYETMKPKDAAPIFEGLDMGIQLDVAQRMKSAKMAAILAAMTPDRARELTSQLATRSQLPLEQALVGTN